MSFGGCLSKGDYCASDWHYINIYYDNELLEGVFQRETTVPVIDIIISIMIMSC